MHDKNLDVLPQKQVLDEIAALYAPLKNYVPHVVPLMLQHAWFRKTTQGTTAFDELMHCSWICRLLTLDKRVVDRERHNEIDGWTDLRDYVLASLDACREGHDVPDMIQHCMLRLGPILDQRLEDNYRFPPRAFHAWWYTVHDDNTHLALHLVNAYQPDSPFDHADHFESTMLQAVEDAVQLYPAIEVVSCGSWLNGVSRFQRLWPQSFTQHQKILNESGGFGPGAWGQYMTSAGGFHEGKADILRRTGRHPFPLTEGRSPLHELITHLRKINSKTAL
jgi:hypothetical protein